jgi:hypothetical protein
MALTAPLTKETCEKLNLCKELGPARITLSPHCQTAAYKEIVINCNDMRDDLEFMFGQTYIEVKNQCSTTPKSLESAKKLEAKVSLGCAATNPKILSTLLGTNMIENEDDSDWINLPITDSPGKQPQYWEVLIEPLEDSKPSGDWRIRILYAFIVLEDASLIFSPETPRSLSFTIRGLMHPDFNSRGQFEFSKALVGDI